MSRVLIYRRGWLPVTETFIADHVAGLHRHVPEILTERLIPGHAAPTVPLHLLYPPQTGARERMDSKLLGRNPHAGRLIADGGFALLHAHFLSDGANVVALAKRHRLPLVVTAHGHDATARRRTRLRSWEGRLHLLMQPMLARWASGIVCVSDYIRGRMIEAGYPAGLLHVERLGVDVARLRPPPPDQPRHGVLAVGRLIEKKGFRYLIEAWSLLPEPYRATPLTIIGAGLLRGALEALARERGVNATFMGAQPREEVIRQMRAHAILALPAVPAASGDTDGLPVVLMEAQALGLAIAVFDEPPLLEAIVRDRTARVARSRDPWHLAAVLGSLIGDPGATRALGRAGIVHARLRFDAAERMRALEDYYAEIVARDAHRRAAATKAGQSISSARGPNI